MLQNPETRDLNSYTWGNIDFGKLGHSLALLDPKLDLRSNKARVDVNVSQIREPTKLDMLSEQSIKARRIICKFNNTFIIDSFGKVYVLGNTEKGCNGTGRKKDFIKNPELITAFGDEKIIDIDCGNSYCLALSETGKVFSWGLNNYGQLGNSPNHCEFQPKLIDHFEKPIKQISCGEYFSVAVDFEGKIYSWGRGDCGQLGHGNNSDLDKPKIIELNSNIVKASAGDTHTMMLNDKGEILITGNGRDGQIGRGNKIESSAKLRSSPLLLDFLKDNKIHIDDIKAGGNHCLASGHLI